MQHPDAFTMGLEDPSPLGRAAGFTRHRIAAGATHEPGGIGEDPPGVDRLTHLLATTGLTARELAAVPSRFSFGLTPTSMEASKP